MSFSDKRDLWYVSGNKERGDIFAIPSTEVGEDANYLTAEIARLCDSDLDGARRWIVIASTGEEAVKKLADFMRQWEFVLDSLDVGAGEQRARFGEMSNEEQMQFVAWLYLAYRAAGLDDAEFLRAIPAATHHLKILGD